MMEWTGRLGKKGKRAAALALAAVLWAGGVFPSLPPLATARAAEGVVEAWGDGWHYYCIDGFGYAGNGVCTNGDRYALVPPSSELNGEEQAILFWAFLSFQAGLGNAQSAGYVHAINEQPDLTPIRPLVTEEDLKGVIHSDRVRSRYPWLMEAVERGEAYLKAAGLLEGTGGSGVPEALGEAETLALAVSFTKDEEGGWTLDFEDSEATREFLKNTPIELSMDGENWYSGTVGGWILERKETGIGLFHPDPSAPSVDVRFRPEGGKAGFATSEECYESSIQLAVCVECSGTHVAGGKLHPLEEHQRNMYLDIPLEEASFYGKAGGGRTEGAREDGTELQFQIYRHREPMKADYRVQLYKYDHETGKPLEGAKFLLYERPENGTDAETGPEKFHPVTSLITDSQGHASYDSEKEYIYDKTFCDGHPAPKLAEIPEEEVEAETGEILNQDMIDQAMAANAEAEAVWEECAEACEAMAESGDHFHWLMDGDGTESTDGDQAYERSGCREDCEQTYEMWISRRYSYTFVEKAGREGYFLHGQHPEDIPIEIITTDSSQNGANSVFAGGYSDMLEGAYASEGGENRQQGVLRETAEEHSREEIAGEPKGEQDSLLYGREFRAWKIPVISKAAASIETLLGFLKGTPAEARKFLRATAATATSSTATPLKRPSGLFLMSQEKLGRNREKREEGETLFSEAFQEALHSSSVGSFVEPGPEGNFSHCNDKDKEGNGWRIYDHRMEGKVHINKRDKELAEGEDEEYDGYGDTQGDGSLQGAVYGLFAAQPLVHPDGKTDVVFRQNDLVSVAVTDEAGDAAFLTITEAPGHTYDYQKKEIVKRIGGWAEKAPGNLYTGRQFDDYSEDGAYRRVYPDLQRDNGNCWIGRPLLLGSYYVKELSRSEGYELSVNGSQDEVSNYGYNLEVTVPEGAGSISVLREPYVEPQSSGKDQDTMGHVLHFETHSQGVGNAGYDMVFEGYPAGSRLYRKDSSVRQQELEVPTGQKEKRYLYDGAGQPVYQRADKDQTYPKQNPDGSFVTEELAVSAVISSMGEAALRRPDMELSLEVLGEGSHPETGRPDWEKNEEELHLSGGEQENFLYVKKKVEDILRANGYKTPRSLEDDSYSDYGQGVFDRGLRGEKTVFGAPVLEVSVKKKKEDGSPVTVGDAILTLVEAYGEMPFYDYGGLDGWRETDAAYFFSVYGSFYGNPANILAPGEHPTIYHRLSYLPDAEDQNPRYLYIPYSNGMDGAFGGIKDLKEWETVWEQDGVTRRARRYSATLSYDAFVDGSGVVRTKTVTANVYYEKGELLLDRQGQPVHAYEWVDVMEKVSQENQVFQWTEIPVTENGGTLVAHVDGYYTDAYGVRHEQENQDYIWKLVLPEERATLKKEEAELLPEGYGAEPGDQIGMGDYILYVKKGDLRVMLDYGDQTLTGDGLYVKTVHLTYPEQETVRVRQRSIKEKIKVTKTVEGTGGPLGNFRFKAYLKSNLERLCRNQEGYVVWQNRRGEEIDIRERNEQYPGLVPPIYTKGDEGFFAVLDEDGLDKFFDALAVANHDKWDDGASVSTSFRPVGNAWNRRKETLKNAERSDGVRQFAIDWYLDEEMKNQKDKTSRYGDERYDKALFSAVKKAEEYLQPFFRYDLDEIYSIAWDGEEKGGKDGDETTLSADRLFEGEQGNYAYGISKYLPYGTYMVVEQQPRYGELSDLPNRHYEIDGPKETVIPTLYEDGEARHDLDWSVRESEDTSIDKNSSAAEQDRPDYRGFSYGEFHDRQFRVRLRLEKLDSETHENILHDNAVFQLYRAARDEKEHGSGKVLRYEKDTIISGSREFLEDMRADNITPVARQTTIEVIKEEKDRYTGVVAAGTPICREEDRLPWTISTGETVDGRNQNAGYGETSEPIPAGAYVICERKPPAGYERSRPVAVEIYSDQIIYDLERDGNRRAAATQFVYQENDSREKLRTARIYIENRPLEAVIEKRKPSEETVTFRLGTRLDGSYGEIGGRSGYEYAWKNGEFQGYGWKKGTLEYLSWLKKQGKEVEIVYQDGIFAGYGYVTEKRQTADDESPYVAGALLALYEGVELTVSGDSQDYAYENLVVERDWTDQVTGMYVKAGDESETDILYYDLGRLHVTFRQRIGEETRLYGYGRDHQKIDIQNLPPGREHSLFAFRDGAPYLEFAGGDLTKLDYEPVSKTLKGDFALPGRDRHGNVSFGAGTVVYHLDRKGNRDSLVVPNTGMAYVLQETEGTAGETNVKILAWAVKEDGEKIATSRTASFGKEEEPYQNGLWGRGEESHRETTLTVNGQGLPMEGEARIPLNNGGFEKIVEPVLDRHGLPVYYPKEGAVYEQALTLYDRDGEAVRTDVSDHVSAYEKASYEIASRIEKKLPFYHRRGERYIFPNIWKSGVQWPDYPFTQPLTDGKADVLTRIPAGSYILEELESPKGYVKGLPKGLTVEEREKTSAAFLEDDTVKVLISKVDGTDSYEKKIHRMNGNVGYEREEVRTEDRSAYTHGLIAGAELALYPARRVYTEDREQYPQGYYLEKTGSDPLRYFSTNSRESGKEEQEARWVTKSEPIYLEGIPAGLYLLEEVKTPEGFVLCAPVEVEIEERSDVQNIIVMNDHTRVEVEKYAEDEGNTVQVEGAELTLYDAHTKKKLDSWVSGKRGRFAGFMEAFEEMYRIYGTAGRTVGWQRDGKEQKAFYVSHTQIGERENAAFPSAVRMLFRTEEGMDIRIGIYERKDDRQGKNFSFEYQFDYRRLPHINAYAASYETTDGVRRFDYLPVGLDCVLVETAAPEGYEGGGSVSFVVQDSSEIQRYLLENKGRELFISKTEEGKAGELLGARLALYRADEKGEFQAEAEYFVEEWISGKDGVYTDEDQVHGRIPKGYQAGDRKPHKLKNLPTGVYYLAEWESPEGYVPFAPIRFAYEGKGDVELIRVTNKPEEPETPQTEPETTEPESTEPTEPETTEPETTEPESTEPAESETPPESTEPTEPETPTEIPPKPTDPVPTKPEKPNPPKETPTEPKENETQPVTPTEPVIPGKITAVYSPRFWGHGSTGTFGNLRIPKTGDAGAGIYVILFVLSLAGFGALSVFGERKKKDGE